jgi:antitoxin component YwqK of YwqJK toxin-antitoxin module
MNETIEYFKDYYKNKQLWYKGEYVNGQQHGLWSIYQKNGNTHYKGKYLNGREIGFWYEYDYKGKLSSKEFWL